MQEKATLAQIRGQPLCKFENVRFSVPRGNHDIELYPTFMRMHGKTFDHKILYQSLQRLHHLRVEPRPEEDADGNAPPPVVNYFVLMVDPAIRQGNSRYNYLVVQVRWL